jgi:hypothetical protein
MPQLALSVGVALGLFNFVSAMIYIQKRKAMQKSSQEYDNATYHIRFKVIVIVISVICIVYGSQIFNP